MSDCTSDGYDDGGPSFCITKNRKARKSHICYECKSAIVPGEIYEYCSGLWEGQISSYKTCNSCVSARNEVQSKTGMRVYIGMVGCAYLEMLRGEI